MSTLVAQNVGNGSVSTSMANVVNGSAKAWVNFNGNNSPGTIRAQHNVSSVTKNGTGDYTVNFANALPDSNYCVVMTPGNSDNGLTFLMVASGTNSTTGFRIYDKGTNGVFYDRDYICIAVFD